MNRIGSALFLSVPVFLILANRARENGSKPKPIRSPETVTPAFEELAEMPFISSLPEIPPSAGFQKRMAVLKKRNDAILDEVETKKANQELTADNIDWTYVMTSHNQYAAEVPVMTDALKLEGIRVNVDFTTAQKLADVLGVYLLTPKIADAINLQSGIRNIPAFHSEWMQDGTGSHTKRMVEHSLDVDKKISSAPPEDWKDFSTGWNERLVLNPGKYWINTARNWERRNYGANYGWYIPTGKGIIQGPIPGLAHDIKHVDYSQVFRAIGPTIKVYDAETGGEKTLPTEFILTNKELAPLISNEGALPAARHPNIPPYKPEIV